MKKKHQDIVPKKPNELNSVHFEAGNELYISDIHDVFHINRIEDVVQKIKFPIEPIRKTVNDFIFLEKGNSIRNKGLNRYEFGPGTFFFMPAFQISSHDLISKDSIGFYCHFGPDFLSELMGGRDLKDEFSFWSFENSPIVNIDKKCHENVLFLLNRLIIEQNKQTKLINKKILANYLYSLFLELLPFSDTHLVFEQNAGTRIFENYRSLLTKHIYKIDKITKYAEMLSISADHLNKCVKTKIGKTAQELLNDMIILESKTLLNQTNLNINEIAFRFAEKNPSDFSRLFKSKTGLSPKEYRKISDFA